MMKEKNDKKGKKNQTKKQQRKQNKKAATSCIIMQPLLPLQSTRRILTYGGYFEAFMNLEQNMKGTYSGLSSFLTQTMLLYCLTVLRKRLNKHPKMRLTKQN